MSNPYGMSDDEFLDCLGPNWSEMTQEERDAYGPPNAPPLVPTRSVKVVRKPRRVLRSTPDSVRRL